MPDVTWDDQPARESSRLQPSPEGFGPLQLESNAATRIAVPLDPGVRESPVTPEAIIDLLQGTRHQDPALRPGSVTTRTWSRRSSVPIGPRSF